jgi:hypothetical protein
MGMIKRRKGKILLISNPLKEHNMQAIEFEATAHQHTIRIPDTVPDGVTLRVLLLLNEESVAPPPAQDFKSLLAGLAEGLTDEDMLRPRDFGRETPEWDT